MNTTPRVTVLLPVYNGKPFLRESIESILGQSFCDFELLVIDDGSTDGGFREVGAFSDRRIRLVRQEQNRGLVAALNLGLGLARGEYLARMDADDISLPARLARQVAFMDDHPAVGVCGSWLEAFSGAARTVWVAPLRHEEIYAKLLFESTLYHPTVIIRKSLLDKHALRYAEDFPRAQDYELWSRCVQYCQLANLGEVLLDYRLHANSVGSREADSQQKSADAVRLRWLQKIGLQPTGEEIALHRQLSLGQIPASEAFLEHAHDWLLKIGRANAVSRIFPEGELSQELTLRWFLSCSRATSLGPAVIRKYLHSSLSRQYPGKKLDVVALAAKCVLRWSKG